MGLFSRILGVFGSRREGRDVGSYSFYGGSPLYTVSRGSRQSAVLRGIGSICGAVASMSLHDYRVAADGERSVNRGRLDYLFNVAPNSQMNGYHFKYNVIRTCFLWGNCLVKVMREGNEVFALVMLDPTKVAMWVNTVTGLLRVVYDGKDLNMDDVLHLYLYPDERYNGLVGMSLSDYGAEALKKSYHVSEFQNGFFAGGSVSGILSPRNSQQGMMASSRAEKVRRDWLSRTSPDHGGVSNSVVVLDSEMEFQKVTMSARDAMMLEMADFSIDDIARVLNVPPSYLYKSGGSSVKNEEEQLKFYTQAVMPVCEMVEAEIQRKVYRMSDYGFRRAEFDYSSILKVDVLTKMEVLTKQFTIGGLSPNEVAIEMGRLKSSQKGADDRYIQQNAQPIHLNLNAVKAKDIF